MTQSRFLRLVVPSSAIFGVLYFGVLGIWYVLPLRKTIPVEHLLSALAAAHGMRYLGTMFSVPGVVSPDLPPLFSRVATWGDVICAVLGLVAAYAIRAHWNGAIAIMWAFNVIGLVDLVTHYVIGRFVIGNPGQLGACFFHVAMFAPALLVAHIVMIYFLTQLV